MRRLVVKGLLAVALVGGVLWALVPHSAQGPRLAAGAQHEPSRAPTVADTLVPAVSPRLEPPALAQSAAIPTHPPDEASLMAELRSVKDTNPALAEQLARDGNRRYPDSALAPERASILIHALANEGRPMEARGEAEDMVNRYPNSDWVREIEAFTGAHRHGNAHYTDDGQIAID
ncbi:MAG TPA: hypothetical protein VGM29_05135 [Polyangiaceae bacterium]